MDIHPQVFFVCLDEISMPRRKKTFPCGHTGYGQVCRRCLQEKQIREAESATAVRKRQEKEAWESTFASDPIDLRSLPAHVVLKARRIIEALQKQQNYRDFGGKRLRHDRCVISIPITRNYRMICRDSGSILIPQEVLSHEAYNVRKPGG